jgi:hypothetical protein
VGVAFALSAITDSMIGSGVVAGSVIVDSITDSDIST